MGLSIKKWFSAAWMAASAMLAFDAQAQSLSMTMTAAPTLVTAVDQRVLYTVTLTNTGVLDAINLMVSGTIVPDWTCNSDVVKIRAPVICAGTYTVTQADIDAGVIVNTAAAVAMAVDGSTAVSASATALVTAVQAPSIDLTKTANPGIVHVAGETITYTFVVTNNGNVTLHDVVVSDPMLGAVPSCDFAAGHAGRLIPGEQVVCTGTYTVTQADIDAGVIVNTAMAEAFDLAGNPVQIGGRATVVVQNSPAAVAVPALGLPGLAALAFSLAGLLAWRRRHG